jgi:hypothetical protein
MFYILAYLAFLVPGIFCFVLAVKFWRDKRKGLAFGFLILGIIALYPFWFFWLVSLNERPSDATELRIERAERYAMIERSIKDAASSPGS